MIAKFRYFFYGILFFFCACKEAPDTITIPDPSKPLYGEIIGLSKEAYYDKVLGALVGSAIGDAMGLSTEMWDRLDIQQKYGYILGLTPALSNASPEGPWDHNLPAGATTDDTRWKAFITYYIQQYGTELNATNFSKLIVRYYQDNVKKLTNSELLEKPDLLDAPIKKINWIKEWSRVALAYNKDPIAYNRARDRFYGGEMSCAGLLYTPMFGLLAVDVEAAYTLAYDHTLFDIGYARDISSLAAAMCNMAMQTRNIDSILKVQAFVDPYKYQDSRLLGRTAHFIATNAENYILEARQIDEIPLDTSLVLKDSIIIGRIGKAPALVVHQDFIKLRIPKNYPGTALDWFQQDQIYQALEENQRLIAFNAGEIWEILYAGLYFGAGNFLKTMQFIVNYGRDNDTVAAIAGMILGAKDGFDALPEDIKYETLRINKEVLGIDLEELAKNITAIQYPAN